MWVEHDSGAIKDATLATVTAAAKLGEVHLIVAGANVGDVAEAATKIAGVGKVHVADGAVYDHVLPEAVAPMIVELMGHHDAFVAPATANGKNIAPRVAALLDVMQVSEILSVEGEKTFTRPIYAGNAIATVKSNDAKLVITVRATGFEKAAREGGTGTIEAVSAAGEANGSSFVGAEISKSERPRADLGQDHRLGRPRAPEQREFPLDHRAARRQARRGRRCEPRRGRCGLCPPTTIRSARTGKIVAPEVYMAVGISGAIQHLAGMKDSKTIIAINKDEDAPIFQVADIGLVGDLFKIVPELTSKL